MSIAIPAVTGWSTFYGTAPNAYQPQFARSSHERRASIALSRGGFRAVRELMETLNGAAAGGTATDTYAQAGTAQQGPTAIGPGGVRVIDTITTVNRATIAADITALNARVVQGLFLQAPTTYPVDTSGNGGGGKRGI